MPLMTYRELVARIGSLPPRAGRTRIVAVDGPAGSGKTSFARRLAAALGAPLVQMDDLIPGWDGLREGAARLMEWVIEPLLRGGVARYQRYDWDRRAYVEWHDVGRPEVLVIEGVSSGSRAPAEHEVLVAWLEAPRPTRMTRGLERDGQASRPRWERWFAEEDELFATEATRQRAHLRVDGAATVPHDLEREFVVLDADC
jgi:uridine kinase